jgi:hypothetical protein
MNIWPTFSSTIICSIHRLLSRLCLCLFLSLFSLSLSVSSPLSSLSSRSLTDLSPIISVSVLSSDISFPLASFHYAYVSYIIGLTVNLGLSFSFVFLSIMNQMGPMGGPGDASVCRLS